MAQPTIARTVRARYRLRTRANRTVPCLFLLAAFTVLVYFAAPPALPVFFQALVGFAYSLLAMIASIFAVREFGQKYNRIRIPGWGAVQTAWLVGMLAFALSLGWWMSAWAPIAAR